MRKLLAAAAVIAITAVIAPPLANAHEPTVTAASKQDALKQDSLEVGAARRFHHYRHHAWRHRWHPRYGFYGRHYHPRGYYAYGYNPYYRPGPRFHIGPRGFSFGWL